MVFGLIPLMIVSALLAIACAMLTAAWLRAVRERDVNAARLEEMQSLRLELDRLRADDYQLRRRLNAMNVSLADERVYSRDLEADLADCRSRLDETRRKLEQMAAQRVRAEKEVSGAQLKAQLYERQYDQLKREYRDLEKRFTACRQEKEALAAEPGPKKKTKKAETLDQITMSDLFDL